MKANILSLGLTAPGLGDFEQLKMIVADKASPNTSEIIEKYNPSFLPPNERRRTTKTIKLALKTAEEAWRNYHALVPNAETQVPVLFVSKDGDTFISANMCQALVEDEPMVSPTQFHNSVHNAPVGYWMIGMDNKSPASAISAGEYEVGNGLLEAFLQSQEAHKPVLVVFYDLPIDEGILLGEENTCEEKNIPFAFAMVLEATDGLPSNIYPTLSLSLVSRVPDLEGEGNPYQGVPAAEAYPFLTLMAKLNFGRLDFDRSEVEVSFPLNEHSSIKVVLNEKS